MFVVLTKSDCDIKHKIFKVKKPTGSALSPPLSVLLPLPRFPSLGNTENYLLISAGETRTHTQEGVVREETLGPSRGLRGAAGLISPAPARWRPSPRRAGLGSGAHAVPFPREALGSYSSGSLEKSKCPARLRSLGAVGAPTGAEAFDRPRRRTASPGSAGGMEKAPL